MYDNHNHHGSDAFGLALLVGAIAFAFGARTARTVVQVALLTVLFVFLYVAFRVVSGTV